VGADRRVEEAVELWTGDIDPEQLKREGARSGGTKRITARHVEVGCRDESLHRRLPKISGRT
jgi:hypothetical protein